MKFEHFALNVPDSRAMADWYVRHCAMTIVFQTDDALYARFLADSTGRVIMEIYSNPSAVIPDYASQGHLVFHHAYEVDDPDAKQAALLAAGASRVEELRPADGSLIYMLRDPWGIPLQLCKRARPLQ